MKGVTPSRVCELKSIEGINDLILTSHTLTGV